MQTCKIKDQGKFLKSIEEMSEEDKRKEIKARLNYTKSTMSKGRLAFQYFAIGLFCLVFTSLTILFIYCMAK